MHPTVKPVALVAEAIKDCSRRGQIVLDCFGGSGTTLIAAEKAGRQARLIEFDPTYCDQILHRFERTTGKPAQAILRSQVALAAKGNGPAHRGALFVGVLIEYDTARRSRQQPRQLRLAFAKRQWTLILAVELQQVERVQPRIRDLVPTVGRVEHGDSVGTDDRFTVQGERRGTHRGRGRSDGRISIGPIMAAAGEQANGLAVPTHDQPIAVVLDLVHPVGPGRRLGGQRGDAGLDKAIGADAVRRHGRELAA
jgi:DNA methylase